MQPLTRAESKILNAAKIHNSIGKLAQRLLFFGAIFITMCSLTGILLILFGSQEIDERATCQMTFGVLVCCLSWVQAFLSDFVANSHSLIRKLLEDNEL